MLSFGREGYFYEISLAKTKITKKVKVPQFFNENKMTGQKLCIALFLS